MSVAHDPKPARGRQVGLPQRFVDQAVDLRFEYDTKLYLGRIDFE
jgi:hypothetical protein